MFDDSTHPASWDSYHGQGPVKEMLQDAIAASKALGQPLEHVFLAGGPGIGKTALASLMVQEMGCSYRVHSGPLAANDVILILQGLEDGDVLVIEEGQRLLERRGGDQWLLAYLERGKLSTPVGEEAAPKVTVIMTTMSPEKINPAVVQRFQLRPNFQAYTDDEAAQIAIELSRKILAPAGLPDPDVECAMRIARASRNHPRVMKALVTNMRNAVLAGRSTSGPDYDLTIALSRAGLTPDGLDARAQAYLQRMFARYGGAPAGKQALQDLTGIAGSELQQVEQVLQERGFVVTQGVGRRLTGAGITRALALAAA